MICSTPGGQSFSDARAVKDYLLPGLWKRADANGRSLDLVCHGNGDISLRVDQKVHPLFTANELAQEFWTGKFNPRVIRILEEN